MSKSIVTPYGIAISSVLAYLLPIDPELSSTLCETSTLVNSDAKNINVKTPKTYFSLYNLHLHICFMKGANSALELNGRTLHFKGATIAGRER